MPALAQHLVDMSETQCVTALQLLALLLLPPGLLSWVGTLCSTQGFVLPKAPCWVSGFAVAVWKGLMIRTQGPGFSFCTQAVNSGAGSGCRHGARCAWL